MTLLINAYCTMREVADPDFATMNSRRDRRDTELAPHLDGFCGYLFERGGGEMTVWLYSLIQHVQRVQNQLSFELPDDYSPDALCDWAVAANAILFVPDGSVLDPGGSALFDASTGGPEDGSRLPYPTDAIERLVRTGERLEELGVPVARGLPPALGEGEMQLREPGEVARRMLGLFIAAVQGESVNAGEPMSIETYREKMPQAVDALTPAERTFIEAESPTPHDAVQFSWRYEGVAMLAWALGLLDELPFPDTICDVPGVAGLVYDADPDELIANATLRPAAEILDALDLHYRIHWAVREHTHNDGPPAGNADGGVVMERHHALNWLTRFEPEEWDEIRCPT